MSVNAGTVGRTVGITTTFKDLQGGNVPFLQQRIAVIGQGSTAVTYSTTKAVITSAAEVAQNYGAGSPLHLAVLQLLPSNGDGVGNIPITVYPLADGTTASAADITPSGTQTVAADYQVRINNILSPAFTIAAGATVAAIVTSIAEAINAEPNMPVVATDSTTVVDLASKWKGASANDIYVEVIGSTTAGTSFALTQAASGATNPTVDAALAQIGPTWETMVLNCLELADSTALNTFQTYGEGRWGTETHQPLVVFTGNNTAAVATVVAITDARKADKVNSVLVSPGANDLPLTIAARELSRIVLSANQDPASGYGSLQATGLTPGADSYQWDSVERESAVLGGCSTVKIKNDIVNVADVLTCYHPDGEAHPAYRYVSSVVKLQTILFSLASIFDTPEWDGAPLVPDSQTVTNPNAKQPKMAKAAVATLLDALGNAGIISDPNTAKAATQASINGTDPNRLDIVVQVQLSGNANVISIDLNFGFFFGTV